MRPMMLMLLLVALLCAACEKHNHPDWTVLVYMAADNGLSDNADGDINEMEAAGVPEGVQVLVLVDRNAYADNPSAVVYRIEADDDTTTISSPIVRQLGEINTADPQQLADFANWGYRQAWGSKRALIVWGHGNAWYRAGSWKSVCDDSQSNATMDVSNGELRQAMLGIRGGVDLLMFDACLMQTAEVVSEVSDRADWVVGSLDKTCVDGLPYHDILRQWSAGSSAAEMASRTVYAAVDSYRPGGSQQTPGIYHAVYSAVDCDRWEAAQWAVGRFVQVASVDTVNSGLNEALYRATTFNDGDEMIDLAEFLGATWTECWGSIATRGKAAADTLTTAIPAVDVYGYSSGTTGRVSVWFPRYASHVAGWEETYRAMRWSQATGWIDFLSSYLAVNQ